MSEAAEKPAVEVSAQQYRTYPAMWLYVGDWRNGEAVNVMTPEQRGAFIHLLCHAWPMSEKDLADPCTLPDDDAKLAALSGLGAERWAAVGGLVRDQFARTDSGRLRNGKQWRVYLDTCARSAAQGASGRVGMKKRYEGRPPRETWLTPYANAWRERYGGELSYKPATRPLAELRKTHGDEETLRRWCIYLAATDAAYANAARFASTFGRWEKASDTQSFNLTAARSRWAFYCENGYTKWPIVVEGLSAEMLAELQKVKPWAIARTARDATAAVAEVARRMAA